jgi:hypothetical protein
MCDALIWSLDAIRWPETISTFFTIITTLIGFFALQTWKHQGQANRKAEFLDKLIEAAYTYIAEISAPITLLELAKIGMSCHLSTRNNDESENEAIEGAIRYIDRDGNNIGQRLREELERVKPLVIKLRSLTDKGQVIEFSDYNKCFSAVLLLTQHFGRMEAFMAVITSPMMNWEHAAVIQNLKNVIAINPNEIRASVKEQHDAIMKFASQTYIQIYK